MPAKVIKLPCCDCLRSSLGAKSHPCSEMWKRCETIRHIVVAWCARFRACDTSMLTASVRSIGAGGLEVNFRAGLIGHSFLEAVLPRVYGPRLS